MKYHLDRELSLAQPTEITVSGTKLVIPKFQKFKGIQLFQAEPLSKKGNGYHLYFGGILPQQALGHVTLLALVPNFDVANSPLARDPLFADHRMERILRTLEEYEPKSPILGPHTPISEVLLHQESTPSEVIGYISTALITNSEELFANSL